MLPYFCTTESVYDRADMCTTERTTERTCERPNVRPNGHVNDRTYDRADMWTCVRTTERTCERACVRLNTGVWTCVYVRLNWMCACDRTRMCVWVCTCYHVSIYVHDLCERGCCHCSPWVSCIWVHTKRLHVSMITEQVVRKDKMWVLMSGVENVCWNVRRWSPLHIALIGAILALSLGSLKAVSLRILSVIMAQAPDPPKGFVKALACML